MRKIACVIIFMFVWQAHLSIACTFQAGMGKGLEILSRLDQSYQKSLDSVDFPFYINTLIQTGKYPNGLEGIPGFSEEVTAGVSLTRSANAQEACLMSKAIIRTAVYANDSAKGYNTLESYQSFFKESERAGASPIILQHLKVAILTAELAIVKGRRIRGFRQNRLEWKAKHRQKCKERSATCVPHPHRSHHRHLHPHHRRQTFRNPINKVIRIYESQNGILFGFKDNWRETLIKIASSSVFDQAFEAVSREHNWIN